MWRAIRKGCAWQFGGSLGRPIGSVDILLFSFTRYSSAQGGGEAAPFPI